MSITYLCVCVCVCVCVCARARSDKCGMKTASDTPDKFLLQRHHSFSSFSHTETNLNIW